ncbi:MAG: peptidase [Gemmatimonadetes bacterium]|nr:peptidase [Gemmatimonadota bacterium]
MFAKVSPRALRLRRSAAVVAFALSAGSALALPAHAQGRVTSPKDFFGFNIGDDYKLATYTQFIDYWKKIDGESDRMVVQEIGKSAEGRPQLMAIITSPENFKLLDRYKEISRKLAQAEGLTDAEARALAKEGKAVVWFDGGLHATEVLGAHQLIETTYQLVSRNDEETQRFLKDLIILAVHANPDGMELVSGWYMQEPDDKKKTFGTIPRLYQKYVGHDNNRDFFILNQNESINIARIQYHEWYPQIVYNHHQTGPAGTMMFAPPFRDPFNYAFDPLIPLGIDMVGASMHTRFAVEGKPGVTMRTGASYSTWWNGGLRTAVYFHNQIGLLTETIGSPTPMEVPLVVNNQLPRADLPYPIAPQQWHFRQSIDYSITANWGVFDIASKRKEDFLFNMYKMGKNSIERGSRDSWTTTPHKIAALQAEIAKDRSAAQATGNGRDRLSAALNPFGGAVPSKYFENLRRPADRDPRGYILPASQADFGTATKFVNALRKSNITVHRATAAFSVGGTQYPAGSYVVKTAQAFRPYVLDMFEPQDHPNDFAFPGGPPKPPYDNAGWTLAYQMGIKFDRVLDAFDCPCEKIDGMASAPALTVASAGGAKGYVIDPRVNDGFIVVNRALKSGAAVYRVNAPLTMGNVTHPAGAFYISASGATKAIVEKAAKEMGVPVHGTSAGPGNATRLSAKRIALWDTYGGSMPSGHTRWLLEQFEFPFDVVYAPTIDAGNLKAKYDVIVFVTGAIPAARREGGSELSAMMERFNRQPAPNEVPAQFRPWLGRMTADKSVPQVKQFLEAGGTVITVGTSTNLAFHLGLPVYDYLVEKTPAGEERELPREKFYVPGSILRASVDNSVPVAYGLDAETDVFFDDSPTFRLGPDAALKGVRPVAWYASDKPLRSGWAWGQGYLEGGVAAAEAKVGKGMLYLFGPEITFRATPHGTFKFLFNGIYASGQ